MGEEKKLIKRARKGDKMALLNLIMREKDEFYRLSYSYMKNENDAMNSLQDMMVKLYENITSLKDDGKFYTWSKTILVNTCKDELMRNKRLIPMDDVDKLDKVVEEDKDSKLMVEDMLAKLSPKHREVIQLSYLLGYDYKTISEILAIPLGTVKSRINTGMNLLKDSIREDEDYDR